MEKMEEVLRYKEVQIHTKWKNNKGYVYEVLHIANIGNLNPKYPISVVFQNPENKYVYVKTYENFIEKMTPAYLDMGKEKCILCQGKGYYEELYCSACGFGIPHGTCLTDRTVEVKCGCVNEKYQKGSNPV